SARPVERLGGGKRPIERGRRVDVLRKLHAKPLGEAGEIPDVERHVGLRRVRRVIEERGIEQKLLETIEGRGHEARHRAGRLPGTNVTRPYITAIRDALEHWRRGAAPPISVHDCARAVRLIDQVYEYAG